MSTKVWVLTREINAYEQDGAYFEAVFKTKPSLKTLAEYMQRQSHRVGDDVMAAVAFLEHLRAGGGRRGVENEWFVLEEVEVLG